MSGERSKEIVKRKISSIYCYKANERKKNSSKRRIENDLRLKKYIHKKLKLYWSPEQIAGRLRREKIIICHETIYVYIILHKKLRKYLRCQKGKYRRRHGTVPREKAREYEKRGGLGKGLRLLIRDRGLAIGRAIQSLAKREPRGYSRMLIGKVFI